MKSLPHIELQPPSRRLAAAVALTSLLSIGYLCDARNIKSNNERLNVETVHEVQPQVIVLKKAQTSLPKRLSTIVPQVRREHIASRHAALVLNRQFVAKYFRLAQEVNRIYHVPIDLTLAQASHESDYGQSELSRKGHGFFGIKAGNGLGYGAWNGPSYDISTDEVTTKDQLPKYKVLKQTLRKDGRYNIVVNDHFRKYNSDAESFLDYGNVLVIRGLLAQGEFYQDAQGETDPYRYLHDIATDSNGPDGPQRAYATDPDYEANVSRRITEMHTARIALGLA